MIKKKFRYIPLVIIGIIVIWTPIAGIINFYEINSLTGIKAFSHKEKIGQKTIDIGDMEVTNTQVQKIGTSDDLKWKTYVSVLNVNHRAPLSKIDSIVSNDTSSYHAMHGIIGNPSFMVNNKNLSSWRFQLHLNNFFIWGGLFIVGVLLFLFHERETRNSNKNHNHIRTIKNVALIFGCVCMFGSMIKFGISYYFFDFLNSQYGFETSIPLPHYLMSMGIPVVLLLPYLQQAVRLQEEQDLTI